MQSRADHLENTARVFKDVIVPEAEDSETLAAEIGIAPHRRSALGVLPAVRLDDQRSLETGEIDDVRRDDVLALELERRQSAVAKHGPEAPLGGCRIGAHFASPVAQFAARWRSSFEGTPLTLPPLRGSLPLPIWGEGLVTGDLPRLARLVQRHEGELALRHDPLALPVALAARSLPPSAAATSGPASAARHRR